MYSRDRRSFVKTAHRKPKPTLKEADREVVHDESYIWGLFFEFSKTYDLNRSEGCGSYHSCERA